MTNRLEARSSSLTSCIRHSLGIRHFAIALMPRFTYVALDSRGQESTGLVEASSTNEAIGQLRQAGYFPTNVYEEGKGGGARRKSARDATPKPPRAAARRRGSGKSIVLFQRKTVKPKMLMIFTRQLATLIDAGLPLLRGLNVLAKQERDPVLKKHDQQAGRFRAGRQHVFRRPRATSAHLQRSLRQHGESRRARRRARSSS